MMMMKDEKMTSAEDEKILMGSSVNDIDAVTETEESLKKSEKAHGAHMALPQESVEHQKETGNRIHSVLEEDHRIYSSELENALRDTDAEETDAKSKENSKKALVQKQIAQKAAQEQKELYDTQIHMHGDNEDVYDS